MGNQTLNKEPSKGKQGFSSFSIVLSKLFRIFDRDGDKSVSRCEMKGIVENLFHLIAESRREDKSPKEVKTFLFYYFFFDRRESEGRQESQRGENKIASLSQR